MNQSFGIMDSAYRVGKNEVLKWVNDLLKLNIEKIETLGNGTAYCQMMDIIFPGEIQLSQINWNAANEYDFLNNFKLMTNCFQKQNVQKNVEVSQLVKCKYQDNLQFAQWFKKFFQLNCGERSREYDAVARRGQNGPTSSLTSSTSNTHTTTTNTNGSISEQTHSVPLIPRQDIGNQAKQTTSGIPAVKPATSVASVNHTKPAVTKIMNEKSIPNPIQRQLGDVYKTGAKLSNGNQADQFEDINANSGDKENNINVSNNIFKMNTEGKGVSQESSKETPRDYFQSHYSDLIERLKEIVTADHTSSEEQVKDLRILLNMSDNSVQSSQIPVQLRSQLIPNEQIEISDLVQSSEFMPLKLLKENSMGSIDVEKNGDSASTFTRQFNNNQINGSAKEQSGSGFNGEMSDTIIRNYSDVSSFEESHDKMVDLDVKLN